MEQFFVRPVEENRKLTDMICEQIEGEIARGALAPGDKLPSERQLAEMFSVSRATVAKAIAQLEMKGLVRSRQGDGTFVCDTNERLVDNLLDGTIMLSGQNLEELVEVRRGLECEIARLAAVRADEADVEKLKRNVRAMDHSLQHPDDFVHYDLQFHIVLAKASKNRLMVSLIQLIQKIMYEQMTLGTNLAGAMARSLEAHQRIIDAVVARDSEGAYAAMDEHLSDTMGEVRRVAREP